MRLSILPYVSGGVLFGLAIAALPANPSTGLICHTTNPADCYPRIFEPTKDFQIIRDDQDIPPGLHVRMDIYSGKKEARLNIPMDGDAETDIETQQAMAIVDQPEQGTEETVQDEPVALRDKAHKKPPAYEPEGKILPPREPDGSVTDGENFERATNILGNIHPSDDSYESSALATLLELSHDIYYGVELMKKIPVVQQLMFSMVEESPDKSLSAEHRRQAAGVLANSLQNNPTALQEAQKSWRSYLPYPHSSSSASDLQAHAADQEQVSRMLQALRSETDPAAMKAKIYALSGLIKDHELRDILLEMKGLEDLLSIFRNPGDEWDSARMKIAQFVMDNFLDADMGAEPGTWPTEAASTPQVCAKDSQEGFGTSDGCWVYHVSDHVKTQETGQDDGWSGTFLTALNKEEERLGGLGRHHGTQEL